MRIGAFEIIRPAGSGGMGTVWEGRHSPSNLPVAMKFLTHERARTPAYAAAFEAEARAVARLNHPRVVRVYDVGRVPEERPLEEFESGTPYIVMEWAPRSLADLPRPLAWQTARAAVMEVLDALAQVHARGIVHRDIKPSNILGRPGRLRLADFGIARLADGPDPVGSSVSGTPYFMPPEQFTGAVGIVGPSSDLYSVGCLAFLLATGRYPFDGDSVVELARQHIEDRMPVDGLTEEFVVWLRRMTAKRRERRFRFAAHAAMELARIDHAFVASQAAPTERWLSPKELATETLPMTTIMLDDSNIPSTTPLWQDVADVPGGRQHLPHWRGPEGFRDHVEHLRGAGLRLSAMRRPPLVGRDDERDLLWGALKEVVERRRPRIATVVGPRGMGKSRLARWPGERGHELGACTCLVSESDGGGFLLGDLRDAIGGRDREELAERIDALGAGDLAGADRNALVRLLCGEFAARSDDERRRLLLLGLRLIARDDALVLLVEDVDRRGPEAVEFAHYLARHDGPLPILTILTSCAAIPDPGARLTAVELAPLGDASLKRIVGDLVELHPDLAVQVVDRAAGVPAVAVAIVRSLVADGRLRSGKHGYELIDAEPVAPTSDDARVRELVDRALADFGRHGRDAIELAAAIGDRVRRDEWHAVAAEAATSIDEDLETALDTRGLIESDPDGFRFVSREFRDELIAQARERNDWKSRIAICRIAIDEPGALRTARWDFEAGAFAAAAAGYLALADEATERSDPHRALTMLGRATDAAAELGADEGVRLRAEVDVRKALLWARERLEDAEELAASVEETARAHDWNDLLATALERRARFARKRVELETAAKLYEEARVLFEELEDDENVGVCLQGLGMCAVAQGELDAAEQYYDEALQHFLPARDLGGAAWCANGLGDVFRKQGDWTVAQSWYERALNWFDTVGNTYGMLWCVHDLAQTRRAQGELAAAEADYERTLKLARQLGQRVVAPRLNLGITRVERGDFDGARATFEEVAEESRARNLPGEEGIALLCLMPCDAAASRWDDVADKLQRGRELIGTLVDEDLGRMAMIAADHAQNAGRHALARTLVEFARSQGL